MARVSVVIPSSNRREQLKATFDSILAQSCQNYEIVIADDASSDGTGLFVLQYLGPDASRAERVWRDSLHEETGTRSIQMSRGGIPIRYLYDSTLRGAAAARNRAVSASVGEFLAFAEAGDVWAAQKLEVQLRLLEQQPEVVALLCADQVAVRSSAAKKRPVAQSVPFEEALVPPGLAVTGSVVRRATLDWEGPFDENLPSCEEYDFWLRLVSRFEVCRIIGSLQTPVQLPQPGAWNSDRYRVYSMEKAFQGGHLNPLQRHRVAEALIDRCERLSQGYRQRENVERANFYERKRKRFVSEVAKLDVSDPLFATMKRERGLSSVPA
ncbi:MAG: glycosyltransferase family 2 protein [Candidatus Eisenbacteria bacterium]|nr:glycosyltransferase family 2 protein [Candidatus Eisenbacteria bacterium]MCC7143866.1 glycosyltransferase family 2 protein [Candidatus Eisenbacteria bacterium]